MPRIKDLAGKKVNMLLAIKPVGRDKHGYLLWKCKCDCGNEKVVSSGDFRKGHYQSCGCLRKIWPKTHGKTKTRLYRIWTRVKSRCFNSNVSEYDRYGGRGITICKEWEKSYEAFQEWALNNGYKENLTLDRKDNNGNYEPQNCRWATAKQQNRNRRDNHYVTINGETKTCSEWAETSGVHIQTFLKRIRNGISGTELLRQTQL